MTLLTAGLGTGLDHVQIRHMGTVLFLSSQNGVFLPVTVLVLTHKTARHPRVEALCGAPG